MMARAIRGGTMTDRKFGRRPLLFGATSLAAAAVTRRAFAAPLAIRLGWATMPGHLIPVLFQNPTQFGLKHYGTSYTVQCTLFRGSSPQLTAVAGGELDLFASAASTLALGVTNAHLDLQVVADIIQDGVPGWHSDSFLVHKDSPIKTVSDLKGKRLAINAIGSAADTIMRVVLKRAGLQDRRDYVVIQAAFPAMPSLLEKHEVDCAIVLQPGYRTLMKTGNYRVLFQGRDAFGATETVFLAGRKSWMQDHNAQVQDFMEDWVRSRRWFMAPANRTAAVGIVADFMHLPPEQLDYLFTHDDYYRDPWSFPNIPGVQKPIDAAVQIGVLKQEIKVSPDHADLSFVEEAKKRIKANA
jgi:NitT/TauT family transport system substrate-binding protein